MIERRGHGCFRGWFGLLVGDSEAVRSGSVLQGFRVLFGFRRFKVQAVSVLPTPPLFPKPRTRDLPRGSLSSSSSSPQAGVP